MNTLNSSVVISALPASWVEIRNIMKREWIDGEGDRMMDNKVGHPNSCSLDETQNRGSCGISESMWYLIDQANPFLCCSGGVHSTVLPLKKCT
ncbi:hypothetical protein EVAR_72482_1 [Eumeta japonica]|uniref:Uncharacterized protein n=1 Tax=Eumeta variegata TaxID=151549 RepID=A0A4C1SFL8_EUMVA|nr:hypothetical protein EVAR_72482_1 [Eumeta japonica]